MDLSPEQHSMLTGDYGKATRKAMQILVKLGEIYGAQRLVPVSSVQVAGVSYDNLGESGLHFLSEMADGGGQARVFTTLNPAGMDIDNWQVLGIDPGFVVNQQRVLDAFAKMGIVTTCSCTPYLVGNVPHYGENVAWAESSAVCYANSVLGARTNREGGPSALASALTGYTAEYGLHLVEARRPEIRVEVHTELVDTMDYGALGKTLGEKLVNAGSKLIPYIQGISHVPLEQLKSFCASLATYGGIGLFHMEGITPEAATYLPPAKKISIGNREIFLAKQSMQSGDQDEVDFISLGCPHLSLPEIARIANLLEGQRVEKEFWITTARPTKQIADRMGYTAVIEASGAKFAADTCCVVAPLKGRFNVMATDSAKACYYAQTKNRFKTVFRPFDEIVQLAIAGGYVEQGGKA
jgi:predicted aconitase